MDVLIRYGFSIEEIQNMMDTNLFINSISDNDISALLNLLEEVSCRKEQIKNISITNPFYFSQSISSIKSLFHEFKNLGFSNIATVLDSNPYLLNLSSKEIHQYFEKMRKEGVQDSRIQEMVSFEYLV